MTILTGNIFILRIVLMVTYHRLFQYKSSGLTKSLNKIMPAYCPQDPIIIYTDKDIFYLYLSTVHIASVAMDGLHMCYSITWN